MHLRTADERDGFEDGGDGDDEERNDQRQLGAFSTYGEVSLSPPVSGPGDLRPAQQIPASANSG